MYGQSKAMSIVLASAIENLNAASVVGAMPAPNVVADIVVPYGVITTSNENEGSSTPGNKFERWRSLLGDTRCRGGNNCMRRVTKSCRFF